MGGDASAKAFRSAACFELATQIVFWSLCVLGL